MAIGLRLMNRICRLSLESTPAEFIDPDGHENRGPREKSEFESRDAGSKTS